MIASIVVHGRNDNYCDNFMWRCTTVLNKFGASCLELDIHDVEIVLCDWGSRDKLIDILALTPECRDRLNYVYVPPSVARKYDSDSPYSSSHAVNAGARHANGRYIIMCDGDTYWQTPVMKLLRENLLRGDIGGKPLDTHFFWASRRHIPKSYHLRSPSIGELDLYIEAHQEEFEWDRLNMHDFMGTGVALLAHRDMWYASRGFDQRLIYSQWNDIDFHRRLSMRYQWGGDLESYGMRFFHLEHYNSRSTSAVENPRPANKNKNPTAFQVNEGSWGIFR